MQGTKLSTQDITEQTQPSPCLYRAPGPVLLLRGLQESYTFPSFPSSLHALCKPEAYT